MAQASVLNETEIRHVFRIVETTRHAERNRLASCCPFTVVCALGRLPR